MHVVIVCSDGARQAALSNLIETFRGTLPVEIQEFGSPAEAVDGVSSAATPPNVVIFSLVKGTDPYKGLRFLGSLDGKPRIIVEVPDNGDDPDMAIRLLRRGAYVVVSRYLSRTAELWRIIRKAMCNDGPHERILDVSRSATGVLEQWGFMSMTFNPGDQNDNDYDFAIKPVTELLGLELRRLDEIDPDPRDLRESVRDAIAEREVLVAQVSSTTANTMYEVGYADAQKKKIIVLWRRGSTPVPALIVGFRRVEYSTMTELAMKLFFGLGGTRANL